MTPADLEHREFLVDLYAGLGGILGIHKTRPLTQARLLGRHLTVFEIPSAATPNLIYYVVGSKKDGWKCSCVGYQSSGSCYHARAVDYVMRGVQPSTRSTILTTLGNRNTAREVLGKGGSGGAPQGRKLNRRSHAPAPHKTSHKDTR